MAGTPSFPEDDFENPPLSAEEAEIAQRLQRKQRLWKIVAVVVLAGMLMLTMADMLFR